MLARTYSRRAASCSSMTMTRRPFIPHPIRRYVHSEPRDRFEIMEGYAPTLVKFNVQADSTGITRCSRTYPDYSSCDISEFPTTALAARELAPATSYEVTLNGQTSLMMQAKGSLDFLAVGTKAHIGVSFDSQSLHTILVQKLLEPDRVMVTIAQHAANSEMLASKLIYDLAAPLSLSAGAIVRVSDDSQEIRRYVFDLSKAAAQAAYNSIFSDCSTRKADEIAIENSSCVSAETRDRREDVFTIGAGATIAGSDILCFEETTSEVQGQSTQNGGNRVLYRESKFSEKYTNYFTGTKSINWESLSVLNDLSGEKRNHYRLNFKCLNRMTSTQAIEDFHRFGVWFGVELKNISTEAVAGMSMLQRVLLTRDDTETHIDLYFSDQGIRRMDAANFNQSLAAHLMVQGHFDAERCGFPFLLKGRVNEDAPSYRTAAAYAEQQKQSRWMPEMWQDEADELARAYFHMTGRSIFVDGEALFDASEFSQKMAALNQASDEQSVQNFFIFLGRSTGYDFMKTIAAMSYLAGLKNTLVRQISMQKRWNKE